MRLAVWILALAIAAHPVKAGSQGRETPRVSKSAVEELLITAEKAFEEGRYGDAATLYRQVLRDYPDTPLRDRLHIKLAESYQKNNVPADAAVILERFLDEFPDSPEVDGVLTTLADLYIELGDLQRATDALERQRGLLKDPDRRREVTERLVDVLVDRGERLEAVRNLLQIAQDPESAEETEATGKRIDELIRRMDESELTRLIELYERRFPSDLALLRLADLEEQKGLLFEADRELKRFLDSFPEHPQTDTVYARLFGIKKQLKEYRSLIGVMLPMAEKYQPFAVQVLNGVRLAVDRFTPSGPAASQGKFVGLVIRNTEGDPDQMERSFDELVGEYDVVAVVGPLLSRNLEKAAREARRNRVPMISPSATRESSPSGGGYLFRNSITLREQAGFIAEYALTELGFHRFSILHPDDAYGTTLMRAFRDSVLKNGGEIVDIESYPADAKDMGPQIRTLKKADLAKYGVMEPVPETEPPTEKYVPGFEALYLPGEYDQSGLAASQLAFYDISGVTLLGSNGWNSRELIRIGGDYIEGGMFVDGFFSGSDEPAVREFSSTYRQRYGTEPSLLAAQAYDAAMMLLQGIQSGANRPDTLREYLETIRDFPGASGTYQFVNGGYFSRPLRVIQVKDGQFVEVH